MRAFAILIVVSLATPLILRGQVIPTAESSASSRNYHLLREDDDLSFLADPTQRQDLWDSIKYIHLRSDRYDWFLSIGGEVRYIWGTDRKRQLGPTALHERLFQRTIHALF